MPNKFSPRIRFAALLAAGLLLVCSAATAQTVSGHISGTVMDSSGLPVPNAVVTLTNEATGERRTQNSNPAGDFVFSAVLPGRYTIAVEAKGFKRAEKQHLNITAAERLAAGQFALEVGTLTEAITVTAEGTPVQTTSQERSALLTPAQMSSLMSRGRDFLSILRVLPGVVLAADPDTIGRTGFPNIQGMRMGHSSVNIDGLNTNDLGSAQALATPMNMDAVSEVKVLLSNYQAEYGRSSGALVNVVTKSGTRDFQGTAYYYKRHEQFNANNFFNNRNRVNFDPATGKAKAPRYRYNTWGYNLGGPAYIPGKFNTKKDKLFFFFSHEILPTTVPGSLQNVTMPTADERNGDFSKSVDLNNQMIVIRDPIANAPFAGNVVPRNRIDANGQKLLSWLPIPNALDRSITRGTYNYTMQEVRPERRTQAMFRTDYSASDSTRMYFRGAFFRQRQDGYGVAGGASAWGAIAARYRYTDDSGVYSLIHTFSPTLVNELSVSAHHDTENTRPQGQADIDKVSRSKLGMTLSQFYPQLNPLNMVPWMSFGGITGAASFTTDRRFPMRGADTVFNFSNNLTKVWGSHTVKTGFWAERVRDFEGEQGINAGSFDFGRDVNNPWETNYAYANAVLGYFRSYQESNSRIGTNGRGTTAEWFVQDNWRATRRLTLDYGLRFTWYAPYYQADGKAAGFVPERYDPKKAPAMYRPTLNAARQRVALNPLTGALAPTVLIGAFVPGSGDTANGMVLDTAKDYPLGFMDRQGVLFAPRIGFALDVFGDGKTAIRGGFGIFYNTRERILIIDQTYNPPVQYNPIMYYDTTATFVQSAGTWFPSTTGGISRPGNVLTAYNFSLGVQRNVGFGTVLDVAYVGNLARHLLQSRNINTLPYGTRFLASSLDPTTGRALADDFLRPYPGYSSISIWENASSSNYHSLQMQANRRFARGLQFGAAWTWSKAMDFGSNDWMSVAQWTPWRVWNYGKADFDRTHNLQINWLWDVPKATKVWDHPVVGAVLDNWRLAGIAAFVSGTPSGVGISTTDGADIPGGGDGVRPVVLAKVVLPKSERTFTRFFNNAAFGRPPVGTYGNAPRDVFRRPGTNNFDISIFKDVPVKENARFQLRWEMYNAFNHTQFSGVDTGARFDPAGNQVNANLGTLTSAANPRLMQASLRFLF